MFPSPCTDVGHDWRARTMDHGCAFAVTCRRCGGIADDLSPAYNRAVIEYLATHPPADDDDGTSVPSIDAMRSGTDWQSWRFEDTYTDEEQHGDPTEVGSGSRSGRPRYVAGRWWNP